MSKWLRRLRSPRDIFQGPHNHLLTWSNGFCGERGRRGGMVEIRQGHMTKKCSFNDFFWRGGGGFIYNSSHRVRRTRRTFQHLCVVMKNLEKQVCPLHPWSYHSPWGIPFLPCPTSYTGSHMFHQTLHHVEHGMFWKRRGLNDVISSSHNCIYVWFEVKESINSEKIAD